MTNHLENFYAARLRLENAETDNEYTQAAFDEFVAVTGLAASGDAADAALALAALVAGGSWEDLWQPLAEAAVKGGSAGR
jgi:hypothetical protein